MIHLAAFIESSGYLGQYFTICPFRSTSGKQGTQSGRPTAHPTHPARVPPGPTLRDASAFAAESLSIRRAGMMERLP